MSTTLVQDSLSSALGFDHRPRAIVEEQADLIGRAVATRFTLVDAVWKGFSVFINEFLCRESPSFQIFQAPELCRKPGICCH